MRRPQGYNDRNYIGMESFGHHTAEPILAVCLERNGALSFGVSTRMCLRLTDTDRAAILETIQKILDERKRK
jgi:hypothetical protein